jgi:hypothetical protein
MVSHLPSREAALVGGLDIAASAKFASRAMSPDGPKAKSGDVRFCAAVGGEADIRRAYSERRLYEYAP